MSMPETAGSEVREIVRRFLQDACPPERVRALIEAGEASDTELWDRLGSELGLTGLHVAAHHGGGGGTLHDLAVVLEEAGGALAPVPLRSTVAVLDILQLLAPDVADGRMLLSHLAAGTASGAVIVGAEDAEPTRTTLRVTDGDAGEVRLQGEAGPIVDVHTASTLVAFARDAAGRLGLYAVADPAEADARGSLEREGLTSLDLTRPQGRVRAVDVPVLPLVSDVSDDDANLAIDRLRLLLSCEALGVARRCLASSVEYARARTQFNRPIGSFQAIKHDLSRVHIETERAAAAVRRAVAADGGDRYAVATATLVATGAAVRAATSEIHVHGGTGFTWEHDAHLRYRRAVAVSTELGSERNHEQRLATELIR